jgi:hypothetical protein
MSDKELEKEISWIRNRKKHEFGGGDKENKCFDIWKNVYRQEMTLNETENTTFLNTKQMPKSWLYECKYVD